LVTLSEVILFSRLLEMAREAASKRSEINVLAVREDDAPWKGQICNEWSGANVICLCHRPTNVARYADRNMVGGNS
jgi:hypothetical protein